MSENALLSLIQNRTGDFGAPFAHLRGSALQPLPQCTATVLAVHCIRPCSALPLSAELKNMGEGIPLKIRYSLTLIT